MCRLLKNIRRDRLRTIRFILVVGTIAVGSKGSVSAAADVRYDGDTAMAFVGAQHWNESGWYADKGFQKHYDGYFCLCECHPSDEGIFCKGAGVHPDGRTKVAEFLGVFSEERLEGTYSGDVVAYNTTTPFSDHFTMNTPGGPSNYTGVSTALGAKSFVWRGYMSGVNCAFKEKCENACEDKEQYAAWAGACV